MARIVLVRHTEVARHWSGRCYGQTDAGLSREGREAARRLAPSLAAFQPARIVCSSLRRARYLAGLLLREGLSAPLLIEPRLAECHFGDWEGRTWDAIYAATGPAMMGMVEAPDTFRPGRTGETTFEVRARAMAWFEEASQGAGTIIAICHGGPIAAIRGSIEDRPVAQWPSLVPRPGERVMIETPMSRTRQDAS